jgi:hypothetical protein
MVKDKPWGSAYSFFYHMAAIPVTKKFGPAPSAVSLSYNQIFAMGVPQHYYGITIKKQGVMGFRKCPSQRKSGEITKKTGDFTR